MRILLTGGAGYIGSPTAVELVNAAHEVVILDNLANSSVKSIHRVERLTNQTIQFYERDVIDTPGLDEVFKKERLDAVVHFAGLKAVGESVEDPLEYYRINLNGALSLCQAMLANDVKKLVFSSSATIYGEPTEMPISEQAEVIDATNPYGRTKLMIEKILEDLCHANPDFNVARLRYFNPAGAHVSGEIGEDPRGIPSNLLPFVSQVAVGKRAELTVFSDDYPTADGTCIRDYIHVVDLALGHLAAINKLEEEPGLVTYNLGTGQGYSVFEIIHAFEKANNLKIPYSVGPRRSGDIPASFTDPNKASDELGWSASHSIEDICRDAWHWQQKNPSGYQEE